MRVWALVYLAALPACTIASLYACADSAQCSTDSAAGRCEPTGFCSFPDEGCESGHRYGEFSGSLSDTCVPTKMGGSTGLASTSETPNPTLSGSDATTEQPGSTSAPDETTSTDSGEMTSTTMTMDPSTSTSTGEGVDEDLLGWWRMDDEPGDGVLDSSGNDNHGSCIERCPTLAADGTYAFSGDEIIELPGPELSAPVFTLSVWASPEDSAEFYATLLGRPVGTGVENTWGLAFFGGVDNGIEFVVGGVDQSFSAGVSNAATGGWHHYAGRFDGTTAELFIDGELAASIDVPEGGYGEDGQNAFIAGELDNGTLTARYTGAMDDLRFYRRVLTDDEIQMLAANQD